MTKSYKVKNIDNCLKDKKKIERSMVMSSNTISDPKTVMVISLDTNLTFFTVSCSVITSYFANMTIFFWWF